MLYTSNTAPIYPMTMADVRAFCSLNPTDQSSDAFFTDAIEQIISRIEDITDLWLCTRNISVTVPACRRDIRIRGRIQTLVSVTVIGPDGKLETITDKVGMCVGSNQTTIYLRDCYEGYVEIEFVSQATVTPALRMAILTAIRNAYVNRQADPLTAEVQSILAPYISQNI